MSPQLMKFRKNGNFELKGDDDLKRKKSYVNPDKKKKRFYF